MSLHPFHDSVSEDVGLLGKFGVEFGVGGIFGVVGVVVGVALVSVDLKAVLSSTLMGLFLADCDSTSLPLSDAFSSISAS